MGPAAAAAANGRADLQMLQSMLQDPLDSVAQNLPRMITPEMLQVLLEMVLLPTKPRWLNE